MGINEVLQHFTQIGNQAVLELTGLHGAFSTRAHKLRQIFLTDTAVEKPVDGFVERFKEPVALAQTPLFSNRDGYRGHD
ncbi:hypothetical protein D3C73_888700 [compost metagenome]